MSTRFGFFRENIQRDTGAASVGTFIDIDVITTATTVTFAVSSNIPNRTLKYQLQGISNVHIAEQLDGNVSLGSNGNANVVFSTASTMQLVTDPTEFNLSLSSEFDFHLKTSSNANILPWPYLTVSHGNDTTKYDNLSGANVVVKQTANTTFTIDSAIPDYYNSNTYGDIRLVAAAGGGGGCDAINRYVGSEPSTNGWRSGDSIREQNGYAGGGGGVIDIVEVIDTSSFNIGEAVNVTIGAGGATTIAGSSLNPQTAGVPAGNTSIGPYKATGGTSPYWSGRPYSGNGGTVYVSNVQVRAGSVGRYGSPYDNDYFAQTLNFFNYFGNTQSGKLVGAVTPWGGQGSTSLTAGEDGLLNSANAPVDNGSQLRGNITYSIPAFHTYEELKESTSYPPFLSLGSGGAGGGGVNRSIVLGTDNQDTNKSVIIRREGFGSFGGSYAPVNGAFAYGSSPVLNQNALSTNIQSRVGTNNSDNYGQGGGGGSSWGAPVTNTNSTTIQAGSYGASGVAFWTWTKPTKQFFKPTS
tara:strand:- start:565 stop:2136 length:1572 start_codon:yes stop_codon:yes gene_type:complete